MENIQDKTALVTGGGSGIGYCTVEELLRNGAKRVAIIDLPVPRNQEATAALREKFGAKRVVFFPCDVTKVEAFEESFKEIVNTLGGLDILVNNAGIFNDKCIEQTFAVNLIALIRGSLWGLDYMGAHKGGKGGTIVNLASAAGLGVAPSLLIYATSKHGVVGFSRCLQAFYPKTNVRILTMCPYVTNTALSNALNNPFLDIVGKDMIQKDLDHQTPLSATYVGNSIVELVSKGKNGAIWCVQHGQPLLAVEIEAKFNPV